MDIELREVKSWARYRAGQDIALGELSRWARNRTGRNIAQRDISPGEYTGAGFTA